MLRSLTQLVRPGGIFVFQEPTWVPLLAFAARFPLWSKLLHVIHEAFLRSSVNPEMGIALYRMFQEVGLPTPAMHIETPLGSDANFTSLIWEVAASNTVVSFVPMVGVWARKPMST